MKSLVFVAVLAAGLPALLGLAQGQTGESQHQAPAQGAALDKNDREFMNDAALDSLLEVRLGQIATKQAANEDVKKFGQRMVDDHTKLNNDLTKLAQQKNMIAPTTLDKKRQDKVDKLSKYGGVEFDKNYMSEMVDDHDRDVKAFEKAAKDAKDPAVKAFAASNLPTLQGHLASAKDIESKAKQEKKP